MIKDVGNAIDHKILEGESMVYIIPSGTKIKATQEFIDSLNEENYLGVFEEKTSCSSKPKVRQIKNAAEKVKGWEVIDTWENKITGSLIVLNENLLVISGFKKVTESDGTRYEAQRGLIDVATYKDIIIINKDLKGEFTIIYAPNMWNKEGINFETKGKDEAAFKISLENVDDLKTPPICVYTSFSALAKTQ